MSQTQTLLHYQVIGEDSSPKLVFLHGIMGQGRNWMSIAKKFSRNFQCLIYDQRGHGKSFHPEKPYQPGDFVDDLRGLLDELGWNEPIYLVGHSMGGRVALQFAHTYPERVAKLVIVDISPSSDWQSMAAILEKLDSVPVPFASRAEARAFFEGEFFFRFPSKMLMEFFYSNMTERNGQYDWVFSKELIRQALQGARNRDYWAEFKGLPMPTLYLRGGDSTDLSQADYDKVVANNPKIRGEVIAGAGHWVHAEKPLETIRIIEDFFNIAAGSEA